MAVSDNYTPTKTIGNAVTTAFTASWNVIAASNMRVYLENVATGVQVLQVKDTDYSLSFNESGLTVDFSISSAPPATEYVVLARSIAQDQTVPFKTSQGFQGAVVENSYDKITSIAQDMQDQLDRCLKFPIASGKIGNLPIPVDGYGIVWDGTGGDMRNTTADLSTLEGNAEIVAADIANIDIVAGIAANVTTVAGISANVTTAASNITAIQDAPAEAAAAAASAAAAAVSAAGVNLPSIVSTDTGSILQVNAGGTGYNLLAPGTSGKFLMSNGPDAALSYEIITDTNTMVLLSTRSASTSATIEFSNLITSTYKEYVLVAIDVVPATITSTLRMQVKISNTARSTAGDYAYVNLFGRSGLVTPSGGGSTSNTYIQLQTTTASTDALNGKWIIFNPAGTALKKHIHGRLSYINATPDICEDITTGLFQGSTAAIDGLSLFVSSGNITSGTFKLYGVL